MHKLDGNVLRVSSIRTLAKGKQATAAQETVGHLAACLGEAMRFLGKERLKNLISRQQALFDLCGELALCRHFAFEHIALTALQLANTRQRIANEHIHDAAAAVEGRH